MYSRLCMTCVLSHCDIIHLEKKANIHELFCDRQITMDLAGSMLYKPPYIS